MRTPEQGHTKRCMANAMISAIENARDAEGFSDFDFAIWSQDNRAMWDARENLADGTSVCTCD